MKQNNTGSSSSSILSRRMEAMKPSPTMALMGKAKAMQKEGKDVIILAAGEPDFNTPDHVIEAAHQAALNGQTKYTPVPGTLELRKAIVAKFENDNGLSYTPDEIIVGTGGKQVLFNAILATVDEGDEVIIPAPYWVSYPEMVNFTGGKSVIVETKSENAFRMTPDELDAAITPRTKWVILNSPSNPTGSVYTETELKALAAVLKKYPHVWVMADDIYEYLVYGDTKFYALGQVAPFLKDRMLVVNGVSKSYAMTGWRIGYGAGPQDLIKAMGTIQGNSTSGACSIAQAAALEGLSKPRDFLDGWRQSFAARRDLVVEGLNDIDGITCQTPEGAFYVYPSCEGLIGRKTPEGKTITSDADFANYLLGAALVAVVPGAAFGLSPYFRISYATSEKTLASAVNRIAAACKILTR